MLKKMKIKKFSFIKKLIYTLIFGICSVCLLGSWTIDSNGNLQSDNLFEIGNLNDYSSNYAGSNLPYSFTNNSFTFNGQNYGGTYFYKNQYYNSGTYTLSLNTNTNNYRIIIAIYDLNNNLILNSHFSGNNFNWNDSYKAWYIDRDNGNSSSFNVDSNYKFTLGFGAVGEVTTTYSNIMLNIGETSLLYEPYGTWYSQTNYDILENRIIQLNEEIVDLEEEINDLHNEYDTLLNNIGTISYDISQYSVSVGRVPNQSSFDYTKDRDINNNFSTIGYLNVSDIYSTYIYNNNAQINNNNSIYIITPQSNLLTFDMVFNYTTQPNTMIKTTLTLPNGDLQQFTYSSTDFNYKGEWTLANLVGSSSIGANYDINDISYKNVLITYENVGNNLSDIKLGSNNGYNTGFNSGYNIALDRINELSVELNEKTTQLQQTTEELTAKTIQYNNLYNLYQNLSNEPLQLNFQSLLWNIASTPFEVFKTMWNFDFLGFNIAQFITR